MTETKLTKTGMVLSIVTMLSLAVSVLIWHYLDVASGLVLFLIGIVLFVPLSCVYIFYLFRRLAQLSYMDPAYKWSKRLAYFVLGGLCCMVSAVPLMYLVMMVAQVFSIFACMFALLGQGIVWIFFIMVLGCPMAEVVLYWKMKSYRM